MRKVALAVLFATFLLPSLASAQNEWIEADPFNLPLPGLVGVSRWVRWVGQKPGPYRITRASVERIKIFYAEGSMNLALALIEDDSSFLALQPKQVIRPGTSVVVYDTKEKQLSWGGPQYQAHLTSSGLDDIARYRSERKIQDLRVQTRISAHYKTVIQVGGGLERTSSRAFDQPLELVLLSHPFDVERSGMLGVQLLYQGKPLAGHMIQAESLSREDWTRQKRRTDERGIAQVTIDNRGKWILSAVQVIPPDKPEGEWREYRGALTFKHP